MPLSELPERLANLEEETFSLYDLRTFTSKPWVLVHASTQAVLEKLHCQPQTLGDIFDNILVGVQSGIDYIHVLRAVGGPSSGLVNLFSEHAGGNVVLEAELVKPFLRGEDVHRYAIPRYSHYCIYPYHLVGGKTKILEESELKERFPLGYAYLSTYREELKIIRTRQKTHPKYWYSCHRSKDMNVFDSERIVTP